MSETPNLELVQNCFNNSWQIYQEIIRFNYMEHQEIYQFLRQYVVNHYPHPFSLLELGCGDYDKDEFVGRTKLAEAAFPAADDIILMGGRARPAKMVIKTGVAAKGVRKVSDRIKTES